MQLLEMSACVAYVAPCAMEADEVLAVDAGLALAVAGSSRLGAAAIEALGDDHVSPAAVTLKKLPRENNEARRAARMRVGRSNVDRIAMPCVSREPCWQHMHGGPCWALCAGTSGTSRSRTRPDRCGETRSHRFLVEIAHECRTCRWSSRKSAALLSIST